MSNIKSFLSSAALVATLAAPAQGQSSWAFDVAGSAFFGSLKGSSEVGRLGTPIDLDFDDVLAAREVGYTISAEGWGGDWGVILDLTSLTLSSRQATSQNGVLTKDLEEMMVEGFIGRRLGEAAALYAGLRYWDTTLDLDLSGPVSGDANLNNSWIDPVVGARVRPVMDDGWFLAFSSDIGGFTLGSDLSIGADAGGGYQVSDSFSVYVNYQLLWVDYTTGASGAADYFKYSTTTHGPHIGASVHF
jgi:hypothetical protein